MLMDVYTIEELDKLEDWIGKISVRNKVMEGLHKEIQQIKDKTQEQFLEVEKNYNTACLVIFEDESKTKIFFCVISFPTIQSHI